jgi:hypothetical protein
VKDKPVCGHQYTDGSVCLEVRGGGKCSRLHLVARKRKILVVEFDVTGLTDKQIDALRLEVVVQGEAADPYDDKDKDGGHPDAPVIMTKVIERAGESQ